MQSRRVLALTASLLGVLAAFAACSDTTVSHPGPLDDTSGDLSRPILDAGSDVADDAAVSDAANDADAAMVAETGPISDAGDQYGNTACAQCLVQDCMTEWKACQADPGCKAFYTCFYQCSCNGPCPTTPSCTGCPFTNANAFFAYEACAAGKFKTCGCK